jgi:hypothetical protein
MFASDPLQEPGYENCWLLVQIVHVSMLHHALNKCLKTEVLTHPTNCPLTGCSSHHNNRAALAPFHRPKSTPVHTSKWVPYINK